MADRRAAAQQHVEAFNAAVRSGSFDDFAGRFTSDAVMRFVAVPVGPFHGRQAILEAYRAQPPDDVMSVDEIVATADTASARFRWSKGGGGTMSLTFDGDLVSELVIEFDRG